MKRRTFFGTVAAGLASLVGIKGAGAVSEKTREATIEHPGHLLSGLHSRNDLCVMKDVAKRYSAEWVCTAVQVSYDAHNEQLRIYMACDKKGPA